MKSSLLEIIEFFKQQYVLLLTLVLPFYALLNIKLGLFYSIGYSVYADNINEIIANLSYSYLAGYIFYVFTSYIPYRMKIRHFAKPIDYKLELIEEKISNFYRDIIPMPQWVEFVVTEDNLKKEFSRTSIYSNNTWAQAGVQIPIIVSFEKNKEEILDLINSVLDYKEYLTDQQVTTIERIRHCEFFDTIKLYASPLFDTQKYREKTAQDLFSLIQLSKKLRK